MNSWDAGIARLGEVGKWHIVRARASDQVHTACSITLADIVSSLRTVKVEQRNGEPTCKHCLRWMRKQKP